MTNKTQDSAEATIWEAHKPYIRGILIAIGSKQKERANKRNYILKELYELERKHKREMRYNT